MNKNAQLTIVGDDASPVVLTSDQQTPIAGDWKGIQINAESGDVIISNTSIEYADKGIYISGKKAKATVTQSTIKNNNYGVFVNGGNVALADHPVPVITNNEISNNVNYNYYTQSFSSGSSRTLNAKGNYWGSVDPTTIAQSIYDNGDTSALPIVDYGLARVSEVSTVTANAGADLITFSTIDTDLIGSGSGTITGYSWQQYLGEPITLINPTSATTNFIAPGTESSQIEQLLSFTLTVTDENDISTTDKLNVIVKPFSEFNQSPVVVESQELLVIGGDEVSVSLTATDGDNDPLTYVWQQVSGETITLATMNTDTLAFTAPSNIKNKMVSFKLSVTDGNYTVERTVIVAVKSPATTAGTYYYHNDHLGTPQVMTDTTATVVWQANYTPFGEADVVIETVTNNIRFPGQYYDEESGLHYNYFRDYDPELGRYIQSDPIGLAGGINTYGYVGGNPISGYDPDGLANWDNPSWGQPKWVGDGLRSKQTPYSVGITGGVAKSIITGVTAGINSQAFSNGTTGIYSVNGFVVGSNTGATVDINIGFYFGDEGGGADTWQGWFNEVNFPVGSYDVTVYWDGSWYGVAFGRGVGKSSLNNQRNYYKLLDDAGRGGNSCEYQN